MHLSARDRRRIKVALAARRQEPDPALAGELNITPFLDVTVNIMLFLLATTAVMLSTVEVHANLPRITPHGHGGGAVPTDLSATLTAGGVILGTGSAFVRPGCESTGPGASVTVPRDADHVVNVAALRNCATLLHRELATGTVILTADPDITYDEVIRAMDALRTNGSETLFTNVVISAGVR